jgi:geranylgeranyl reductase family protein
MMEFDVVVIGLGPGGASATYYAAKAGLSVLGVDRRREVGVPIQCGEFVPQPHTYREILPDAEHIDLLTNFPKEFIRSEIEAVSLFSPNGVEYSDRFDGYVIDRSRFDKWVVSKAVDSGADIMIQATVDSIVRDGKGFRVGGRGAEGHFEVDSKVVIIAAGASSRLNEMVGLKREVDEYNLGHVIQYVMTGVDVDPAKVEMYSGKRYSPGAYAWIIPRGPDMANVGLGIRKPYISREDASLSLRGFLHRFIHEHPVASRKLGGGKAISVIGGLVPVGPTLESVGDGVLLVGDAANQVIASVGAGIPTSVIAGSIAGEVVADHIDGEASLDMYEKIWRREMGSALESGYKLRMVIDVLCRSDNLMEQGLRFFGREHMYDLVRTRVPRGSSFLMWVEKIARTL